MAKPKSRKRSVAAVITVILLVVLAAGTAYAGAVLAAAGVLAAFNARLLFIIASAVVLFFLLCAATKNAAVNTVAIILELVLIAAVAGGLYLFTQADLAIAQITTPADAPASEQMVTTQVNVLVPQGAVTSREQLSGCEIGYCAECSDAQLEQVKALIADVPGVSLRLVGGSYDTCSALLNGDIAAAVIPANYYLILTEEVFTNGEAPAVLETVTVSESLESATSNAMPVHLAPVPEVTPEPAPTVQPEVTPEPVPALQPEIVPESAPVESSSVSEFSEEPVANAPVVEEPAQSSVALPVSDPVPEEDESFTDVTLNVEELTEDELKEIIASNSEDTFIIYFSGIDSFGDISTVSRSDVNILAAVNFNTHKIQLVSTPRDYFLPISVSTGGLSDKLTHCGLYGIQCSMDTLSAAYGINIDYYVRLNFTGFIDIVNALGGIDVYNENYFVQSEHEFPQGMLHLEDYDALLFARHRRTIGDSNRGGNHMKIISAIIEKVCSSPEILLNYNKILSSVANSFQTDFTPELIYSLVSRQIADGRSWEMESYTVSGYGTQSEETYSMWSTSVYVLVPDYNTVNEARDLLESVLNG